MHIKRAPEHLRRLFSFMNIGNGQQEKKMSWLIFVIKHSHVEVWGTGSPHMQTSKW